MITQPNVTIIRNSYISQYPVYAQLIAKEPDLVGLGQDDNDGGLALKIGSYLWIGMTMLLCLILYASIFLFFWYADGRLSFRLSIQLILFLGKCEKSAPCYPAAPIK